MVEGSPVARHCTKLRSLSHMPRGLNILYTAIGILYFHDIWPISNQQIYFQANEARSELLLIRSGVRILFFISWTSARRIVAEFFINHQRFVICANCAFARFLEV